MSIIKFAKDLGHKAFQVIYNLEEQTFTAELSEPSMYVSSGVLSDDLTEMFVVMGRLAVKAKRAVCFSYMVRGRPSFKQDFIL